MAGWEPQDILTAVRNARMLRVIVFYLGASFAVLEAVDLISDKIGLPGWVFPGSLVLLFLGLPIIVATALVQGFSRPAGTENAAGLASSGAAVEASVEPTAAADAAVAAKGWLTWRKAIFGGVLAFALLGVIVTGYMAMRVMGIGPVGSLVAAGVMEKRERIILADFENLTGDSLLAVVVTEAFRIDFSQSPMVAVAEPEYVSQVLARMDRDPGTALDPALAREVAIRDGLRVVITGEVAAVGGSYVLSAEIISAETGEVLAGFRETAKKSDDILAAIDRLSKKLRERIGESFKTIRANPPLESVTTSSLQALQKYSQALRAVYTLGEVDRGIDLLEEAILLDTTFAAAYSELATALSNRREERARAVRAFTKAYEYRDRLTDRERYIMVGNYHLDVTRERDKAIAAYQTALETYPDDSEALNNLGVLYFQLRDFARSEELMLRALATDSSVAVTWGNVIINQVAQGKYDVAEATQEAMQGKVPRHFSTAWNASALASSRGDYETAESHIQRARESRLGSLSARAATSGGLAALARVRGRLAEAERYVRDALTANEERGLPTEVLEDLVELASLNVWFRGDPERGLRGIDAALQRYPLESFDPLDRPYLRLAQLYAWAGSPETARKLVAEREASLDEDALRGGESFSHNVKGAIALAENRPQEAIAEFRAWDEQTACIVCALPNLAMAYDLAGERDSVIAINERYLETPWLWRIGTDSFSLALAYERLGQLYEERGETQKAMYYYGKLLELWKDADPELQPRLESAQRAIAALSPDR